MQREREIEIHISINIMCMHLICPAQGEVSDSYWCA